MLTELTSRGHPQDPQNPDSNSVKCDQAMQSLTINTTCNRDIKSTHEMANLFEHVDCTMEVKHTIATL